MSDLLTQFRSYFWFPWTFYLYKSRFLDLRDEEKKALLYLLNKGLDKNTSFDIVHQAIESGEPLQPKIESLLHDYYLELLTV